jgi:hypothetical protein
VNAPFTKTLRFWLRNPELFAPPIAIALLMWGASSALRSRGYAPWEFFGNLDAQGPGAYRLYLATIAALTLRVIGFLLVAATTAGMAQAAWRSRTAHVIDGPAALLRAASPAARTFVLLVCLGAAAAALVIPTFLISMLLFAWLAAYAMPASVLERRGATDALVDALRAAAANPRCALSCAVSLLAFSAAGAVAGGIAGWLVTEFGGVFVTMAAVGEYLAVREATTTGP